MTGTTTQKRAKDVLGEDTVARDLGLCLPNKPEQLLLEHMEAIGAEAGAVKRFTGYGDADGVSILYHFKVASEPRPVDKVSCAGDESEDMPCNEGRVDGADLGSRSLVTGIKALNNFFANLHKKRMRLGYYGHGAD